MAEAFSRKQRRRKPAQSRHHLEILQAGQEAVEIGLLGDIPETALEGAQPVSDALAVEQDCPARGVKQAGHHFDDGALAGAIGTQHP